MLKNYTVQSDLHGLVPEPELSSYLWNGEVDYSDQKAMAETIVKNDLICKGYQYRLLRPDLFLDTAEEEQDSINRDRIVVICSAVTGTASVAITGANDTEDTFVTAGTVTVTATGTTSAMLDTPYKYYKYSTTGTITITSVSLVESIYDLLYEYKWLELILMSVFGEEGDVYDMKRKYFADMYNSLLTSATFYYDKDEDGEADTSEKSTAGIIPLIR